MKIFIKYKDDKNILYTKDYQSINSIINQYFIENNIEDDIKNYNIDYNGIQLNNDFSLEKYNINDDEILSIYPKVKGGNSFFSFAAKNFIYVSIVFIIVLIPLFILPLGLIPLTSTLIKLIIDKSISSIGKFLVCKLGKVTLFKRMKLLTLVVKYVVFILMIYVLITFPLILLCTTLKGESIMNDPKKMCSSLTAGSTAGVILTIIYFCIYLFYRGSNLVLNTIIGWCKYFEWTNYLFNPIFTFIRTIFNKLKYLTVLIFPLGIGGIVFAYFNLLDSIMPGLNIFMKGATDMGCKTKFSKEGFINSIKKGVKDLMNKDKSKDSNESRDKDEKSGAFSFGIPDNICEKDPEKCCAPENYIFIADSALSILKDKNQETLLKTLQTNGLFPSFCLFIEALFESAIERLENNNDEDKNIKIREIEGKKKIIDDEMVSFSEKDGSKYVSGKPSMFKMIFKIIFLDIFCNVVSTTKVSQEIIMKMGEMEELIDMLKAGSATGLFLGLAYFITIIVLIICGIFNIF
jgi:hypothetical protein